VWQELFENPIAQLILWIAVGAVLVAIGIYVLSKIRDDSIQSELSANEMLSFLRESHAEGKLSDQEFRTLKTQLSDRMRSEMNKEKKKD
jgi:uncharacterized membrane protein